jgi:putative Mn2+ efflux pump MntP
MVALLLVAVSLGLSNFAAAIAIGVTGVDARTRLRVGLAFGLFEAGMPLLGLLVGHGLAGTFGHAARWIGAALLIATGLYGFIQALRRDDHDTTGVAAEGMGQLLIARAPPTGGADAGFSLPRRCRNCLWVVVVEVLQRDYRGILAA